jgi:hypothetical protein
MDGCCTWPQAVAIVGVAVAFALMAWAGTR